MKKTNYIQPKIFEMIVSPQKVLMGSSTSSYDNSGLPGMGDGNSGGPSVKPGGMAPGRIVYV